MKKQSALVQSAFPVRADNKASVTQQQEWGAEQMRCECPFREIHLKHDRTIHLMDIVTHITLCIR